MNATFIQPFVAYNTPTAWTFTVNAESTYDWEAEEWSIPVNLLVARIHRFGRLPVQLGAGIRLWADSPDDKGPDGVGFRLVATLLLPK